MASVLGLIALTFAWAACSFLSQEPPPPNFIQATVTPLDTRTPVPTSTARPFPTPLATSNQQPTTSDQFPSADIQRIAVENSTAPVISADGRFIAFVAKSDTPGLGDANGFDDIYVHDRETNTFAIASISVDGNTTGNSWSEAPAISADGRFVAFYSWANTLIYNDTNGVRDLFLRDMFQGITTRISVTSNGRQANERSGGSQPNSRPAISTGGRYIVFHSAASNLVFNDANQVVDIFAYDQQTRQIARISVASDGTEADGDSTAVALSGDGRFVVFESVATNLVNNFTDNFTDGLSQIYLHDRAIGATTLISHSADDTQLPANQDARSPAISADGRYVAFQSAATNLIADAPNAITDIFIYDRQTRMAERVSVSSAGVPANGNSHGPTLSVDGRYVAFISQADNLIDNHTDDNRVADIFIHDRSTRQTWSASVNKDGKQANDRADLVMLSAHNRIAVFVSSATDLVEQDMNRWPDVFAYTWAGDATYSLTGRVVDMAGNPLAGVELYAGSNNATTTADGFYVFPELSPGSYKLVPKKAGYDFLTAERTLQVPAARGQNYDFRGFPDGSPPERFLDLPFDYDTSADTIVANFLWALRDTDEGGRVDSWFDHAYPNYSRQQGMVLWDGRARLTGPYFAALGCYDRRCYDGHNGIDFPYWDPVPTTEKHEALAIRPAAPGIVVSTQTGCVAGNRRCGSLYGNGVIVDHGNGYFTQYAHLAQVMVLNGTPVNRENTLGLMGTTGNSYGIHLHFSVYRDNGNGLWDGDGIDLPVDPFGWLGTTPDPWVVDYDGPISYWLWRYNPILTQTFEGMQGTEIETLTGDVRISIPANAFAGPVQLELAPDSRGATLQPTDRTMGHGFSLQAQGNVTALGKQFEVQVRYDLDRIRHVNLDELALYRWDSAFEGWQLLESAVDRASGTVTAISEEMGYFDLRAPLLCPDDVQEPNDGYYDAIELVFDDDSTTLNVTGIFDVDQDEDWYWLEATAGQRYDLQVDSLASGVIPLLTLYDLDGQTILESVDDSMQWQAPLDGGYFMQVSQGGGGLLGCGAIYSLSVE